MNPIRKPLAMVGRTFNECLLLFPHLTPFSVFFQGDMGLPGLTGNPGPLGRKVHLGADASLCPVGFLASGVFRQECCVLPLPSPGPDP